ncbi:MAG: EAL domain-containing protein [Thermoanaerobaculia bacterium]|nr:EAL domain-containing protein [Thermoanaerobaculia bacterium]
MTVVSHLAQPDPFEQLLGPELIRLYGHSIHDLDHDFGPIGTEILMRGPAGAPYEMPTLAFAMAATLGALDRLDNNCIESASRVVCDGHLFINVHPETLAHRSRFWDLIGMFGTDGYRAPGEIVFEIVEHSPARESDLPDALKELRALGFRIAIDDLGEGMSGLRRLVEVEPDFVKIDRFFINGIDRAPRKRSVVQSIAALAESTGASVIAEGIETEDELEVVRDAGVRLCQGYYFGKPREI